MGIFKLVLTPIMLADVIKKKNRPGKNGSRQDWVQILVIKKGKMK